MGSENKAARERSFCRDNPSTIQSPRNVKPMAINELVQEKLRTPRATLFSHSFWLGLSCPRLLIFKSSSVNSNIFQSFPKKLRSYGRGHVTPSTTMDRSSSDHWI